ncbi:MAG: type IV pilus modification protein PilV [Cupriavidus sp.]|nr:type IV pilus modification protein PilV [Cupriavidus sp.]
MSLTAVRSRSAAGFALLEVLVTLVITSIGLLGVVKMQAAAMANTQVARGRSLIALQSQSLAAAMHGNQGFWAAGRAPATFSMTGATVTDMTGALSNAAPDCRASTCTPGQLAAYDVQAWAAEMNARFPTYVATVNCSPLGIAPVTCTVTTTWRESYLAYNQDQATAARPSSQTATQSLTLHVHP